MLKLGFYRTASLGTCRVVRLRSERIVHGESKGNRDFADSLGMVIMLRRLGSLLLDGLAPILYHGQGRLPS
jgi:hypothetical protein